MDDFDIRNALIGAATLVMLATATLAGWLGLSGEQAAYVFLGAMGAVGAGLAMVVVGRAHARRRAQAAEEAWAAEVDQVVRTERIEELGDAIGGLSAPTQVGEVGGLALESTRDADRSESGE